MTSLHAKERRRVVVTGVGVLSPLGLDARSSFDALLAGTSGIGPITQFDAAALTSRIAGEVRGFVVDDWMDPREAKRFDRFTHFAVAGARQAIADGGLDLDAVDKDRFGVVIGSGIGGLGLLERQHQIMLERGPGRISPYFIPGMIINMASGVVSITFGLRGPNTATVTACATGNHAIGEGLRIIQNGDADLMLAGGTEAVITPLAVGGFCAMRALSTRNDDPAHASRPFDKDRDGFVMGEGCGVLLLEEAGHATARGAKILAELVGFGMSGDAFHISAPPDDGDGMVRVMRAAIADAGLSAGDIDYVNAHGTSTPTGDVIEARAVRRTFGEHADAMFVSSTKSMTGHLLGAAGGFEAIVTVLAIEQGRIPPTANLETVDPEIEDPALGVGLARERFVPGEGRPLAVRAALSNSFGFGGTNATVVFRKFE